MDPNSFSSKTLKPFRGPWQRELPAAVAWAAAFFAYFSVIAALLADHAFDGFLGDAAAYVTGNTAEYASHPLFPFLTDSDTGHPELFAWINGVLWNLLGRREGVQVAIANVSMWAYAAAALTALNRIGQRMARRSLGASPPRWAGIAIALCLLSTPLFFANTAEYLTEIPNLAMLLLMFSAWDENRRGWLALWAAAAALTRLTGCLAVLGLGLWDLWLNRRELRKPREFLRRMIPWAVSGGIFLFYFIVKMRVYHLPLSGIAGNERFSAGLAHLSSQSSIILREMLHEPKWSFLLWLIPIAVAGLARLIRRRRGGKPSLPPEKFDSSGEPRSVRATLTGFGLMVTGPTLVYLFAGNWPIPRYFLSCQALILIAGVLALLHLMPRRRGLAMVLIILWCGLQVIRWQPFWTLRAFALKPEIGAYLMEFPPFSAENLEYKRLSRKMADWVETKGASKKRFIAGYETGLALGRTESGFVHRKFRVLRFHEYAGSPEIESQYIAEGIAGREEVYMVIATWDPQTDWKRFFDVIPRHQGFKLAKTFAGSYGPRVELYLFHPEIEKFGAPAASGPAPSRAKAKKIDSR